MHLMLRSACQGQCAHGSAHPCMHGHPGKRSQVRTPRAVCAQAVCVQARTCSSESVVCTARASAHTLGTARRTQAHTGCVEHARLAACSVHRMCVPWCARSEHFMRSTSYAKFIVTIRKICCNLPRYDLQLQRDPRDGYVP